MELKSLKLKSRLFFPLLALLSVIYFINCGEKNSNESAAYDLSEPEKKNSYILKVQDSIYFNSDFKKHVLLASGEEANSLSHDSLSRLFDDFIEEKILLEEARNRNISLTEEEQKQYVVKLSQESWPGSKMASIDDAESKILYERLLIDKYTYELVKDTEVTGEEIKAYYDLHKREFLRPERVKVSQILLKTEDRAIEILEKISTAEDFRKVAQELSIGVEASKGGEMGIFEMGQLPFEMEKVIFSLNEGELSPVVESSYGYHIFRLDKKYDPELISLEESSMEIKVKILDQKIRQRVSQHLEELKTEMDWSFYTENLFFPYQRNPHG